MAKSGRGICDTRCQLFYKECQIKEQKLKTLWYLKNKKRLYALLEKSDQLSVKPTPAKFLDVKESPEVEKKEPFQPWRPPGEEGEANLMRPIKPDVKNILYVPKDESFVSKGKYLYERYKLKPEDRYYYPYCASWDYGWRLKDFPPHHPSKFGRKAVIQSSFYRKNASSLQRDPDWYRICQSGDPKNFNEILTY